MELEARPDFEDASFSDVSTLIATNVLRRRDGDQGADADFSVAFAGQNWPAALARFLADNPGISEQVLAVAEATRNQSTELVGAAVDSGDQTQVSSLGLQSFGAHSTGAGTVATAEAVVTGETGTVATAPETEGGTVATAAETEESD